MSSNVLFIIYLHIYVCDMYIFVYQYMHLYMNVNLYVSWSALQNGPREERCNVVGKDIYVDSTFKLESDVVEDTVPLKDEPPPASLNIQEDLKQPSPEPRSEESDVGGSSITGGCSGVLDHYVWQFCNYCFSVFCGIANGLVSYF